MKRAISFIVVLLMSSLSFAYKNCPEEISSIYVGDNGWLWMVFKDGGAAHMPNTDVDFESTLALVLAAHMAGRDVIIRYADDSASCSETRGDIQGVRLN